MTDVASAVSCDYGHWCPAKSTYPHENPCPAGKFSDSTSNTVSGDCGNCPAGYFCAAGSNTFTLPEVICPAGYYCPIDSISGTTNPCPAGTFSANTGLKLSTECTSCPAGSYCSAGAVSATGLCQAGYWCGAGSTTITQNPCPLGTFSTSTGLKTSNECTVCPLGYICATTAMTASIACDAGTYGSKAGLTGVDVANSCTTCTAGSFCAQGVSEPTACGAGMFSLAGAKDTGTPLCTKCPDGSYCALEASTSTDVVACGMGFICVVAGTTGVPTVPFHPTYSCPAGQWCAAGVSAGTNCLVGTYNPTSGKGTIAACLTVPAGYFIDTEGASSFASNVCPAGYYCLEGAISSTTNPCPAGTYRSLTTALQASDCAVCTPGYYCPENTVTPIDCPQGFYCANGVSEPVKCIKGYYGANENLRSAIDCTICPQGRYCSQAGLSEPDGLCDPGFTCGSGSVTPAPPTRRRNMQEGTNGVCPAGGYCEQGSKYATRCPPGTFNPLEGQDEASDCQGCTDGHYCIGTTDSTTSGLCTAGYYCISSSTIPTQNVANPGYFAVAGSGSQTPCSPTEYNPFYAQSACLSCKYL
jgi:hypothetical protein